jgi:hypothetical protein
MTREELIKKFDDRLKSMSDLMKSKNSDYSPESDALFNFRGFGWKGIVVRLGDKYSRLRTFVLSNNPVQNERIEDTLLDNAIYSVLALIVKEDEDTANRKVSH